MIKHENWIAHEGVIMSTALRLEPAEPLRLGPHDHNRELTDEEFSGACYDEGYK